MNFGFKSAETPAQLAGTSPITLNNATFAEGISVVYNGRPFSADSLTFAAPPAATSVPEPSVLFLALAGGLATAGYRRLKKSAAARGSLK